jgi:hypothetical protein
MDATISMVGQRLYDKMSSKKDKGTEVRKSVMTDMRHLAGLYLKFRTMASDAGEVV